MAFGNYCPVCEGIVDNNEFDYGKGMCKECLEEKEQEEHRREEMFKIMNSEFEQMVLEV